MLSTYTANLNKIGDTESATELVKKFKASIRKAREILIQFEQANQLNKETPLHKAFQIDKLKYLSDIYISQEEMYTYRDRRKEDLKDFEKQVEVFETKIANMEGSNVSAINVESIDLANLSDIKNKFQNFQDELIMIWSIVSGMSEDMKRFHSKLKIMESIHSSDDEKYEARQYLKDYK